MTKLTIPLLEDFGLKHEIQFVKANNLIGFPLERLDEIKGETFNLIRELQHLPCIEQDSHGKTLTATYKSGTIAYFEYGETGLRTLRYSTSGVFTTFDKLGRPVEKMENGRSVHRWFYDEKGNLIREEYYNCIFYHQYDEQGNNIKTIGVNDNITYKKYDSKNRCISKGGDIAHTKDLSWWYDDFGNIIKEMLPLGQVREFSYDRYPNGQLNTMYTNGHVNLEVPQF